VENEGMKITVVGALAIAGVFLLVVLLVRILRGKPPQDVRNPLE
jgi:predicted permease